MSQKNREQPLYDLFMQAPAAIAVLHGKNHVFEFTNPLYLRLVDKTEAIHGQTVRHVFPELEKQGFFELLDDVYKTGKPFVGYEMPIELNTDEFNTTTRNYLNFVYQPLRDEHNNVSGIMAHAVNITAQVEAKLQSREDEERYRTLFNSIDQGFCIVDIQFDTDNVPIDYIFREVNNVFEKQTGLKNVISKSAKTAIPNLEDSWIKRYGNVALTGKAVRFTENSNAMGRWFEVFATRLGGSSSHRVAILFTDITKRKNAEIALLHSEMRNRTIVETLEEGVSVLDASGTIMSANKSAENLLGLTLKQMQGRNSLDPRWQSVYEDGSPMPGSEHAPQHVLRTKKAYKNQVMGIHKPDGTISWLIVNAQPILEDGQLTGVVVSFFDITVRKQIQQALERQLQITETITEIASSCLFMINNNGLVTYMNPAASRVTGYTLQDCLGQPMHSLVHHSHVDGKHYPESECPLVATYKRGAPNPLHEDTFFRKDGSSFPALITGTPIPGADGIQSTVVEFRNIEEIKTALKRNTELEESTVVLKEQRAQLVALNNAKDDFVALASHQLRTPATAVKQYLGLVLDGFTDPLTSSQDKYLRTAYDSNERQLKIITDLLRTAKIDSSRYVIKKQQTSISALIEEVITDMQPILAIKNQNIQFVHEAKSYQVLIDSMEMKLVFINLFENASKYSHADTVIKVEIKKGFGNLQIKISDAGVGIANSNLDKIFDKFTRINNDLSDTVTGTGLGLYWVKKIIKLHHGTIVVTSKLAVGTTFIISLPA